MDIIADTREKKEYCWRFSQSKFINNVIHRKLDTGDYSIPGLENEFCIERKKSVAEIAMNIVEARFKNVLTRLREFKHKFIICEFDFKNILEFPLNSGIPRHKQKYVKIKPPFIISCLSKIQVDYQIPVIYAGNTYNAEIIAENIFKRFKDE